MAPEGISFEKDSGQENENPVVQESVAEMRADALGTPESPREAALKGPSEEYMRVQKKIIELEGRVKKTNEVAMNVKDAERRKSFTELARGDTTDIARLQEKKSGLEQEIISKGGNPSDYTVQ